MASIPLEYPVNLSIVPVGTDGFHINWGGASYVYKLAYRRQNSSVWTVVSKSGPTVTGGSGNFTDDTPLIAPSGISLSGGDFYITGLPTGVYDLRAINIGGDGTDYTAKVKYLIPELVGEIPGLQLRVSPAGQDIISVEWNSPTSDSGQNIIVTWCEVRAGGKKQNCESKELPSDTRSYDIGFRDEGTYVIMVSQRHNDAQSAISRELYVHACPCASNINVSGGGGGSAEVSEWVIGEVLQGVQDGINNVFTTLQPIRDFKERVMINGLVQKRGTHYTVANSNEIHFTDAPAATGENLSIDYEVGTSTTTTTAGTTTTTTTSGTTTTTTTIAS